MSLAFTIRDEVLLITTKEDAARDDTNPPADHQRPQI